MTATTPSSTAAGVAFTAEAGTGGLAKVVITAADGACAELYLHGAHLTSWRPGGNDGERLFVSARSRFAPDAAIRGGVPVCFPQFAGQGSLPMHGFARTATWELVRADRSASGAAGAVLRLTDSPATRALWPHAFVAELSVTVAGSVLEIGLSVQNTGAAALAFTGALHTYLRVADVAHATVHGLRGARYRDKVKGTDGETEAAAALRIEGAIDRVYYVAPEELALREPGRAMAIRTTCFPDTVVWNPGAPGGAAIADLEPDGYARMVCVEAAAARGPLTVSPGEQWRGTQTLTAS